MNCDRAGEVATNLWYSQARNYSYSDPRLDADTDTFTQVNTQVFFSSLPVFPSAQNPCIVDVCGIYPDRGQNAEIETFWKIRLNFYYLVYSVIIRGTGCLSPMRIQCSVDAVLFLKRPSAVKILRRTRLRVK